MKRLGCFLLATIILNNYDLYPKCSLKSVDQQNLPKMFNEDLQPDGILDFKDQCPDIQGYRSIVFQKVPERKQLPPTPPPSPLPPEDPKTNYFTFLASDGYHFVIKKKYVIQYSQTIRWILVNPFWPEQEKNFLPFPFIHPYYMTLICKYFNWSYYYGITHFRTKPQHFKISMEEARRLQKIANFLGC